MKKSYILIALAMVAALSMVSCKCSSNKPQEPTQEEIQEMKQALADSVLAYIDACAEQLCDATSKSFSIQTMELTDEEKMVTPDYLLDPSVADTLITKTQKVNALAIYSIELGVRKIYDMPQEETKAVIAKLAVDVNHPTDMDFLTSDTAMSEKIKREYEICKERGDLAYFWRFQVAVLTEFSYLLVQNPKLFFNKITDEQLNEYGKKTPAIYGALDKLAEYDEEMAELSDFLYRYSMISKLSEWDNIYQSKEIHIQKRIEHKEMFIARRNALLQ